MDTEFDYHYSATLPICTDLVYDFETQQLRMDECIVNLVNLVSSSNSDECN